MADRAISVAGFSGVDPTTDGMILGRNDETKSVLAYNYRSDKGVRTARFGYTAVTQLDSYKPQASGVYFPYGAHAVVPIVTVSYENTFYVPSNASIDQDEISVEFWLRAEYRAYDRDVIWIPVDMDGGSYHLRVTLTSPLNNLGQQRLKFTLMLEDSTGANAHEWIQPGSDQGDDIPVDNTWHHVALVRKTGENNVELYVDGVQRSDLVANGAQPIGSDEKIAEDTTFQGGDGNQMWRNMLFLGAEATSLAEVRIWDHARSGSEVSSYMNENLDHTDSTINSGLMCIIPFDEGGGKAFTAYFPNNTDITDGQVEGHLTPQEPYVYHDTTNDRYVLKFTGFNCYCMPSNRSKIVFPADETECDHFYGNEDAGYDGGILWDTKLSWAADKATALQSEGVYSGWAQMRIILRQLKEGVLAGRLGMCFDTSEQKYRLFLIHPTANYVFLSDPVIDEAWIGNEKTVTVHFVGSSGSGSDACTFWVDDTDVTDSSQTSTEWVWASGDAILTTNAPYSDAFADNDGTYGSIAGSRLKSEYCVALDLIFFRQWWDAWPRFYTGATPHDDFVADTYSLTKLTPDLRYTATGMNGWLKHQEQYAEFINDEFGLNSTSYLKYVVLPIDRQLRSDLNNFDKSKSDANTYVNIWEGTVDNGIIKADTLVRRISEYENTTGRVQILPTVSGDDPIFFLSGTDNDGTTTNQGNFIYFSGALISNLVNELDSDVFRLNKKTRPVTSIDTAEVEAFLRYSPPAIIIEDGSPLQGSEQINGVRYKSRYFILSYSTVTTYTRHEMVSRKCRWCTGAFDIENPRPIRGIWRYKSESGDVDKLLFLSDCGVYEFNPDTGELTNQDYGWMDRNSDEQVNGILVNNKLILMDSKSAIKLNFKDNFSRLGIERPQSFEINVNDNTGNFTGVSTSTGNQLFAYAFQFYDSENDAYSGVVPAFEDIQNHVYVQYAQGGITRVDLLPFACLDKNVDEIIIYRTRNLAGTGSLGEFILIGVTGNSHSNDGKDYYRDLWHDDQLSGGLNLSQVHYGVILRPKPCKAIGSAFGRLFIMNEEDSKASVYWSEVDALGFAKVDQVPENYQMIVEEGGTSGGTALVEYSGELYAFKDDAMFRIYESEPGLYGNTLVYKGVGAVNQRATVVARNAIFFIDRNGLYVFQGGEPTLVSPAMRGYFAESVSQDNIDKSFILYDKTRGKLLAFVPASGSTYCDRCIVFDFETTTVTLDLVPDCVCGFVDEDDVYLGTPYGQVLKYSSTLYTDVVSAAITGTSTSVSATSITDTGASFDTNGTLRGAPVYAVDLTNKKIWRGTITSNTATVLTVDDWKTMFNASGDPTGTPRYFIGRLLLYDKSPIFSFLTPQYEKSLFQVEVHTDHQDSSVTYYTSIRPNQDSDEDIVNSKGHTGDLSRVDYLGGLHRNLQMEMALLVEAAFRHKETIFHVEWTDGNIDA